MKYGKINSDALSMQEVRDRLSGSGVEAAASTPEELDRHIRDEMEKWHKVIVAAQIKPD